MSKKQKNIIMITIDSLRNDYYNPQIKNYKFLNHLAKHSTYFNNCFSLGDDTGTTFPQFLSSTYLNQIPYKKHKKGIETNRMCRMDEPRVSIAETLKTNGYNTYSFQTSPNLSPFFGYDKGFDKYKYFNPFSSSKLPFFIKYLYKSAYTSAETISTLIQNQEFKSPFFLWIHFNDVHEPYYNRTFPKFLSDFVWSRLISRPSYTDLSNLILPKINYNTVKKFRSIYKDNLKSLDNCLYSIFIESQKFNINEDIFVLSADHGQALGELGQWGHGYCVLPTRGSSNIPLFVSEPFQKNGKTDNRICSTMDMVPTILDQINIPLLDRYDGNSLSNKNWPGYEELIWSNSLDFDNNLFSVRILDEPYIFWQDDFNFPVPCVFRIDEEKFEKIHDKKIINKYKIKANEHIEYIKNKQLKYPEKKSEDNINNNAKLDKDVFEVLKSLGYA